MSLDQWIFVKENEQIEIEDKMFRFFSLKFLEKIRNCKM